MGVFPGILSSFALLTTLAAAGEPAAPVSFDPVASGLSVCPAGTTAKTLPGGGDDIFKGRSSVKCTSDAGVVVRRFHQNRASGEVVIAEAASLGTIARDTYRAYYAALPVAERESFPSPDAPDLRISFEFKQGKIERLDLGWARSQTAVRFDPQGRELALAHHYKRGASSCRYERLRRGLEVRQCDNHAGVIEVSCALPRGRSMRAEVRVSEAFDSESATYSADGRLDVDGRRVANSSVPAAPPAERSETALSVSRMAERARTLERIAITKVRSAYLIIDHPDHAKLLAEKPSWRQLDPCLAAQGRSLVADAETLRRLATPFERGKPAAPETPPAGNAGAAAENSAPTPHQE